MTEINKQIIVEALGRITQGMPAWEFGKAGWDESYSFFYSNAPEYIRYLLGEVERLEKKNTQFASLADECHMAELRKTKEIEVLKSREKALMEVVEAAKILLDVSEGFSSSEDVARMELQEALAALKMEEVI